MAEAESLRRTNPRWAAMEDYSLRPEVYNLLFRFTTELLTSQPQDPLKYMIEWSQHQLVEKEKGLGATAEKK
ncbi:hypothetical protein KP509_06G081800 [Ceratopteris richardii]|uniref:Uncharacterized protein n=1 Tax=Ceratopteris richardii TaxID=49495 RepID=A0A8T2UQL5_CERRI|nr:hypothetical protein KP509_06G081800 [Ceratopteris richardii]